EGLKVILVGDLIAPTVTLLCYSSFFKQQYEECSKEDYCFFLEDYSVLNPTDTQNHTRSCERKGYCRVNELPIIAVNGKNECKRSEKKKGKEL
ncbi:hypothetical protein X798_07358, partial [Onchocerca flexuosa]